jgi:chemotaxis protein methyltransferase CheR
MIQDSNLSQIEIDLLTEAVFKRYGYDFRQYARASFKRRLNNHLAKNGVEKISDLIPLILYDENHFQKLLFDITVTVTEMFRDPWFYATLREKVLPFISTFPFINIWIAGCSTGEEVFSIAILLTEEKLLNRCRIYATDINNAALEKARERILPLKDIQKCNQNYLEAGGKKSLSNYFIAQYDAAIFSPALIEKVTFASHNLATDNVFGEMHLILCRNVLIYFDRSLQNRVFNLFSNSLRHNGFLCLGSKETLDFSDVRQKFVNIGPHERIYQYKEAPPHLSAQTIEQKR